MVSFFFCNIVFYIFWFHLFGVFLAAQLMCTDINMLMDKDGRKASALLGTNLRLGRRIRRLTGPQALRRGFTTKPTGLLGSTWPTATVPAPGTRTSSWWFFCPYVLLWHVRPAASPSCDGLFSANRFDQAAVPWCHNEKSLCEPHDTFKFTMQTFDWFHIIDHGGWAVNKPSPHRVLSLCPREVSSSSPLEVLHRADKHVQVKLPHQNAADLCRRKMAVKVPSFPCSSPTLQPPVESSLTLTGAEVYWLYWGLQMIPGSRCPGKQFSDESSALSSSVRKHGGLAKQVKHKC